MKIFKIFFLVLILIILIIGSVMILNGYKLYKSATDEISLSNKIAEIKSIDTYVSINEVPKYYTDAVIAVEDHRFKEHGAIDPIAIRTSYLD